jgi:hypothetical protein
MMQRLAIFMERLDAFIDPCEEWIVQLVLNKVKNMD